LATHGKKRDLHAQLSEIRLNVIGRKDYYRVCLANGVSGIWG
jgi:hypothetical protein